MTVAELIARDGNLCGLCNTPIDLRCKFPHPLSATEGHIIPRGRRGCSERPDNRRLEHLNCNLRKGKHLDSELSLPLTPPKPPKDVVELLNATERHRQGSQEGGRRRFELHGNTAIQALYGNPATPEGCSKGGQNGGQKGGFNQPREAKALGNHNRWHVRRGIVNPNCALCIAPESICRDSARP
jgi:hypothetical protein